jgi:hypothetical protein
VAATPRRQGVHSCGAVTQGIRLARPEGHKRTEEELYTRYVLVAIDGTASKRSTKKKG